MVLCACDRDRGRVGGREGERGGGREREGGEGERERREVGRVAVTLETTL